MKKHTLILWLFLMASCWGYAQNDHLVPAHMEYYKKHYPAVFRKTSHEVCRYIYLPAWGNFVGFIMEQKEKKNAFVRLEWDVSARSLSKKRIPFPDTLFQTLHSLCSLVAQQIDFPETEMQGLDGVTYYLSCRDSEGRWLEGESWCPPKDSLVGRWTAVCEQMCSYPDLPGSLDEMLQQMLLLRKDMEQYVVRWKDYVKVYRSVGIWNLEDASQKGKFDETAYMKDELPESWILKHLVYPEELLEKNVWGLIGGEIQVDTIGKVTLTRIYDRRFDRDEFVEEVRRLIANMPLWVPARKDGKAVKSTCSFAVPFNPVAYRKRLGLQ